MDIAPIIAAVISVLASIIVGVIAWGVKAELKSVRSDFTANMAQAELRIIKGINGTYTRTPVFQDLVARVDRIEDRVGDLE